MEEEFQITRRRDRHIVRSMNKKHILLWATTGIAFVLLLALLSLSLRNDSEISKDINKQNRKVSCNGVYLVTCIPSIVEVWIGKNVTIIFQADSGKLDEFKTEITNNIKQVCGDISTLKADLAENCNLNPSVLQNLAELKRENARIAEDVMQILDAVHNFKEVLCTTCPAHWLRFQNSCYLFSFTSNTWRAAQQSCENEGAHLVIVNYGIEQNFLVKHMEREQVFWIGLTDADKENQWVWVDNTTLSLSFWGKDEPNNAGSGEDCGTLRFSGKWNDVGCSENELWICERNASRAPVRSSPLHAWRNHCYYISLEVSRVMFI